MPDHLLFLTNIPTPYRVSQFNLMQEVFSEFDLDFEVWYLAESEPNRWWTLDPQASRFPSRTFSGLHATLSGVYAHFNPGMLHQLRTTEYSAVIVGGLGSPSHWLTPFFIKADALRVLWVESNLQSTTRHGGLALSVKRLIANQYHCFQVTGERSAEYVRTLVPAASEEQFIRLPNLVDEASLLHGVDSMRADDGAIMRIRSQFGNPRQLWLCPARLYNVKGLIEFLPLMKGVLDAHLIIAGDGPLKAEIQRLISQLQLPVTLVGALQPRQLVPLFAASDLFVLPSLKDPSPLSPIEAIAAGLPVIVSDRIGNFDDVFAASNGWAYSPSASSDERRRVVVAALAATRSTLIAMGRRSRELYLERFQAREKILGYGRRLRKLLDARHDGREGSL